MLSFEVISAATKFVARLWQLPAPVHCRYFLVVGMGGFLLQLRLRLLLLVSACRCLLLLVLVGTAVSSTLFASTRVVGVNLVKVALHGKPWHEEQFFSFLRDPFLVANYV